MTSGALLPALLGRPVEFDENMPAIGAGNFPVAFGNWKAGYLIVDKLRIQYLRDPLPRRTRPSSGAIQADL
jgi:HK97 family phage major capsid protein